jgi:outer membrane protein OmpA-like peptidoglycan-associated protein
MKTNSSKIATAAFAACLLPALHLGAQSAPAAGLNSSTPKVELFVGYSYLRAVPTLADGNRLVFLNGGSTSIAYNFNRYLGVVGDFGGFNDSQFQATGVGNPPIAINSSGNVFTYMAGPRLSFRNQGRITPFAQALFGEIHASPVTLEAGCMGAGCTPLPAESSFVLTAGGGLDIRMSRHLALRLVQAEYLMTSFENRATAQSGTQNDMRLSSGIVFRFGGNNTAPAPVNLTCTTSPTAVFPGDPVTVTASAGNLDSRLSVIYSITGPGLTASEATATVATASLVPGSYTVNCAVKEGRAGREGLKPWETAAAAASFTVKAFEPPTISCSANPSDLKTGEGSTVIASGVSPQNRPLTYSYTASAGTIGGSGHTVAFSSANAPEGIVTITCSVTDDKNQTATANTNITITAPVIVVTAPSPEVIQLETRLALHSIFFQTDVPTIQHPDGGLLASQEATLATLATDFKRYLELKPDAYLTLTGYADLRGSAEYNQTLSERRVTRTKLLLVNQGVPEANIKTLGLGKGDELTAAQVEDAIKENPELTPEQRENLLHKLPVVVLAKNRRVDITLSTTGQNSTRLYPFNAADALVLLDPRNLTPRSKAGKANK